MIRVPYTKYPSSIPTARFFLRPDLDVLLYAKIGAGNVRTKARIDTGADQTLVNKSWCKVLGYDWKKGIHTVTYGIAKGNMEIPIDIYVHEIEMEVINLPMSRVRMQVGFIESVNVNVLLGQIGFFDNFKVSFEKYSNYFDIDLKP